MMYDYKLHLAIRTSQACLWEQSVKPVDEKLFFKYVQEAVTRISEMGEYYRYTFKKECHRIPLKNILYFESRNRQVHIFLTDHSTQYFYGKLNTVEKEFLTFSHRFLRIHQSFFVNYDYISKITYTSVTMDLGNGLEKILKISEDRQKEVRDRICRIMRG